MRSEDSASKPLIRKRQNSKSPTNDSSASMEARADHQVRKRFKTFYGITTAIGILLTVLVLVWCIHFRGGFTWQSDPDLEFNLHPLLMVFGLICLFSQSMLIYRTGRNLPKSKLKIMHMTLNLLAFIASVIGLKAVFDSHNLVNPPKANLYTLHSWIGLLTVICFAAMFIGGFTAFLFPKYPPDIRAMALPVHTNWGKAVFFFAVVSTVTGIAQKAIFSMPHYYLRSSEAYVMNFMGMIVIVFGALVLYLVNDPDYQRIAVPEDQMSLGTHNE